MSSKAVERIIEAGATALIIALVIGAFATAGVIERFVNPLRDLATSEPFGSAGMAQQRRDTFGVGRGVEQPQRGVQVDQLTPEPVYLPAVHFDLAGYLRALVAERVDSNGLLVGQRELLHPAIFGYAAAGSNRAVVALAT